MVHTCFIGHNLHFLTSTSGSAVLPREVIKCLCKDVDVSLITFEDGETYRRKLYEEVDIELTNYLRDLKFIKTIPVTKEYMFLDIAKYFKDIRNVIKGENIDIIHIFELPLSILPLVYKLVKNRYTKIVYHAYMPMSKVDGAIKAFFLKRFTDAIIVTSPYILHHSFSDQIREKIVHVIPPPIDTSIYRPLTIRLPFLAENDFSLFYIGPLEQKRFPMNSMINVMEHLQNASQNVKLIIAASPRYRNDVSRIRTLKRVAAKRGVEKNLIIHKRLTSEEKILFYKNTDAVIFPFLRSYRGAIDPPITLLEAMACGGLVIATDTLSFPWVIKDGHNGFLCPNYTQLGDFAEKVLKMTEMNKSLIRNRAIKMIGEYFSASIVRNKMLSFYDKVMTIGVEF